MIVALVVAAALIAADSASAQDYGGHFSTLFDVMPDVDASSGAQPVAELRTRLFAEGLFNPYQSVHLRAGLFVDALLADRDSLGGEGATAAAVIRPADVYAEYRGTRFDVRAGMARIVWGRLDEFQPTDVINPIDLSRFVFEGRSESRLPVALVRGRVFLPGSSTLEGIVVPVFRAGRFDQLDEETSPFRLAPPGPVERHEPGTSWRNIQGGTRFTSTIGRVDWGASAWRGFETFPVYLSAVASPEAHLPQPVGFVAAFPRFTMVGGDFETVSGPWGVRGELAWFDGAAVRSFEGGIGADRRAGNYRVALNAVVSHGGEDTDVTFVGWAERTFARETRSARLLAVYDPSDDTAFVRGIAAISMRDNLWLEGSAGWFSGQREAAGQGSPDVLGLLARRDFLYTRLRIHF